MPERLRRAPPTQVQGISVAQGNEIRLAPVRDAQAIHHGGDLRAARALPVGLAQQVARGLIAPGFRREAAAEPGEQRPRLLEIDLFGQRLHVAGQSIERDATQRRAAGCRALQAGTTDTVSVGRERIFRESGLAVGAGVDAGVRAVQFNPQHRREPGERREQRQVRLTDHAQPCAARRLNEKADGLRVSFAGQQAKRVVSLVAQRR